MKKISLQLMLVGAIVIAAASSFTTKKVSDQNWFRIVTGNLPTSTEFNTSTHAKYYKKIAAYSETTPVSVETAEASCPEASGYVCAARIPEFANNNSAVLEQSDLNLLSSVPSQIAFRTNP